MSILQGFSSVAGAVALLAAPAAFARTETKFGPDLRVVRARARASSRRRAVALNLTLSPSYATRKPGVVVTMTSCNNASLKLLRHVGSLGSGQSLHATARPDRLEPRQRSRQAGEAEAALKLAAPKGKSKLCVRSSMYDNYTKKTININTPIPL